MKMSERDRRDWSLLIFIVPLGIFLMLIAGQFGMRIIPRWTLNTGMGSNLKVDTAGGRQAVIPLFNIGILTPFSWQYTYLTPNAESGFVFPPFVVLEPSATPSPTAVPTTETATPPEDTPTPTEPPPPTSTTPVATATSSPPPPDEGTDPPPPPPTDTPTATATSTDTPTATATGIVSTVPPSFGAPAPIPTELGVGTLPDNNVGPISDGTYLIINLSIVVGSVPDGNYDLAFYEYGNGGVVYLDWIIVGISNDSDGSNGLDYYEVFNWGNGAPDNNSNIGDVAGTEADNQAVPLSELHDPDGSGSAPQTGILIDVDNAASDPPANTYNYIVVISPIGGSGEAAQVDAIQATEVPIPPPPTP